jgi:uncharacterized surface protein with fasciclin (FAS1) repeats
MNLKNFFFIALLAFTAISLTSCGDDDDNDIDNTPQSIAALAQETPDLSILVDALVRADLVSVLEGTGTYTVFAPTNEAFTQFLADNNFSSLDEVPTDVLTNVLLNHVLGTMNKSTDLTTSYTTTLATAQGNNVSMYINTDSGVRINGVSSVTAADIEASNGVIHIVDAVIGIPSVVTFATADPSFETLVAALTRADLTTNFVDLLNSEGPFTVFAPINDAFGDLLAELQIGGLGDIDVATLDAVLKTHVISGANVIDSQLQDGSTITPVSQAAITVDLSSGASLVDPRDRTIDIIATNVQAGNGVIHAINKVILP